MGSALTVPLAANGHSPVLYGTRFDTETLKRIRKGRPHPRLGQRLPQAVDLRDPDELEEAVHGAGAAILATNSEGVLPLMEKLAPRLDASIPLVTIAKGLVEMDGEPLPVHAAVQQLLSRQRVAPSVAALAGPSIAAEVARQVPTLACLACQEPEVGCRLTHALSTRRFHCRPSTDAIGVGICSAFKNIYTIALSWPKGLGDRDDSPEQANLKAILFLQTLAELRKLVRAAGGKPETVTGEAGLGDLVTTGEAGRNGQLGRLLGSGRSTEQALRELADKGIRTVEGHQTASLGHRYADRLNLSPRKHLPLLHQIHAVLHSGKPVREAIDSLPLPNMC